MLWRKGLTRVTPDVVVVRCDAPMQQLPIDAKYMLYGGRSLSTGEVYQAFLYAYAIAAGQALLLYPQSSARTRPTQLEVRGAPGGLGSAEIRALAISVPAALDEVQGYLFSGCPSA
jgi:5-methylcytosine-specific restriction enzyme subunit McrC